MGLLLAIFMVVLLANAPVPPETLFYYMASRALDPFEAGLLRIWYSNVGDEIRRTWSAMPQVCTADSNLRCTDCAPHPVDPILQTNRRLSGSPAGQGDRVARPGSYYGGVCDDVDYCA